jgi:hypothetical protein
MDRVFQKLLDDNFTEIAGLTVDATIPVSERLLNESIETALQGNKDLTYGRVTIGDQNRIVLDVKTPRWPWPLKIKLRLFRSVDLAQHSPRMRAFLENHALLGRLGTLLKALPDGISIYQDQIVVDLGAFLQTPEQKRMLGLLKSVEIRTEPARIILDVKIGVD